MTTIHVRYEILDDPGHPHPDSAADSFAWGVRAVGLPDNLSAYGVGDTLDEALNDLSEGIRAPFGDDRQANGDRVRRYRGISLSARLNPR
jgi:hypothetical protein